MARQYLKRGLNQFLLMKRILLTIGGICWISFAAGFAVLLRHYFERGPGLELFGLSLSGGVLLRLVQVTGLCAAVVFCFIIGIGMLAHGLVRNAGPKSKLSSTDRSD